MTKPKTFIPATIRVGILASAMAIGGSTGANAQCYTSGCSLVSFGQCMVGEQCCVYGSTCGVAFNEYYCTSDNSYHYCSVCCWGV